MGALLTDTAKNIINDTAVELGLLPFSGKLADPFSSTDANIGLLCQLLKKAGRDMVLEREWSHLRSIYTFLTVAGQAPYALTNDYGRFINQTAWNRTNRLPLGGPLSPQEYEFFKARLVGVVFTVLFQILNQNFVAYPDSANTPGGYVIAYEYISRWWVQHTGTQPTSGWWQPSTPYSNGVYLTNGGNIYQSAGAGTSGTHGPIGTGNGISDGGMTWNFVSAAGDDQPTASTDTILFDSQLMVNRLCWDFLKKKGFPSQDAEDEYRKRLELVAGAEQPSPVLNFNREPFQEPLLGERNVPITGFGS